MTIQAKLCVMPDFDAGHTHAAFELQLCYGLKLLFSRYATVDDFVVLFEFHDDLAMILNPEDPSEIKFYQLKSYANDLPLASLLKRDKSKKTAKDGTAQTKDSVIEKLYLNIEKFGTTATSADVVSATHCKTPKTSDKVLHKERFTFDELSSEDKTRVVELLQTRFAPSNIDQTSLAKIGYTKVQMSKEEHLQIVKGAVHDFLLAVTGTDEQPLEALTATIKEICRKKQIKKTSDVSSVYAEAIKQKGVSKSELNEWISTATNYRRCPAWSEILPELGELSLIEKISLKGNFDEYRTQVLNSENALIEKLKHHIKRELELKPIGDIETLENVLHRVSQKLKGFYGHSQSQLKAAIIYEVYTKK